MVEQNKRKGLILGIQGTDESIWFQVRAVQLSIELIDSIFNLSYDLDEFVELTTGKLQYEAILKNPRLNSLFLEGEDFITYLIFENKRIHIILRKVKEYEKYRDILLESFKTMVAPKTKLPHKSGGISQFGTVELGSQEQFGYRVVEKGGKTMFETLQSKRDKNNQKD